MVTKHTGLLFLFLIAVTIRATSESNLNGSVTDMEATSNTCTKCAEICHTCTELRSQHKYFSTSTKTRNKDYEKIADTFFSDHSICPNVTTTELQCTSTVTIPTTTVSQCVATTIERIKTVTASPSTCIQPPIPTPSIKLNPITDENSPSSCKTAAVNRNTAIDMAIGGLLGLSLVLLIVVTTGWVCTCLITKKRNRIVGMNTDDTTDFAEKYFENPTYDGTSMIRVHSTPGQGVNRVPVLPVALRQHQQASSQAALSGASTTTYDAVNTAFPKAASNGQTYDVLDRGKSNCTARKSGRAPKGYSQLGVPDKDVVDSKYHLISKEND